MKKITILGSPECHFCEIAKDFAKSWGLPITYFNIDERPDLKDFLKASGFPSIPQVFIDGQHIGGSEAFVAYVKSQPAS